MLRHNLTPSRKKAIKRTLMRHRLAGSPAVATIEQAFRRDGGCCVVCGGLISGERGIHWAAHHRRGRDGRPDSHSVQNLLTVHGADNTAKCHGRIHGRRSESEPNGWWLSRIAKPLPDPLEVPLLLHGERWVFATADGTYVEAS